MKSSLSHRVLGIDIDRPPQNLGQGVDLPVLGGHVKGCPTGSIHQVQLISQRKSATIDTISAAMKGAQRSLYVDDGRVLFDCETHAVVCCLTAKQTRAVVIFEVNLAMCGSQQLLEI